LTDHKRSTVVCLLNDLLLSAEKLAADKHLSDDRLLELIGECERSVGQMRAVMGSGQETGTGDSSESEVGWAFLRSDETISGLVRQVDDRLRHCVEALSARIQRVAGELGDLRRTRRAAKAYQGLESA
jgi:hypothetical protein